MAMVSNTPKVMQSNIYSAKRNRGMVGFLMGVCQVTTLFYLPLPLGLNYREIPSLL